MSTEREKKTIEMVDAILILGRFDCSRLDFIKENPFTRGT